MWICLGWQSLTFIRRISGVAQGEAVTIPEEVLCKAVSVKDCRTEAFCSRWSKVYRRFEAVSSVTGRIFVACE